jgi:hypothetical protein
MPSVFLQRLIDCETVYLGLLNLPRTVAILGADYSYGLFLYGYPIQQAVAASGAWGQVWGINLFATVGDWPAARAPILALRRGSGARFAATAPGD